jgi:hypothetical protein
MSVIETMRLGEDSSASGCTPTMRRPVTRIRSVRHWRRTRCGTSSSPARSRPARRPTASAPTSGSGLELAYAIVVKKTTILLTSEAAIKKGCKLHLVQIDKSLGYGGTCWTGKASKTTTTTTTAAQ